LDALLAATNNRVEYIGFEPIQESFDRLATNAATKGIRAITFPSAVSDRNGIIKFNSMLGSSCRSEDGCTSVACVRLDDVLHNYAPTFLKMDIEGDELRALKGAERLVRTHRPDLAISVYHTIDHFWEIPNLLRSWDLGYAFYLRTHSSACMETVLYATVEDAK
jgi:FkbM family methyltransferase